VLSALAPVGHCDAGCLPCEALTATPLTRAGSEQGAGLPAPNDHDLYTLRRPTIAPENHRRMRLHHASDVHAGDQADQLHRRHWKGGPAHRHSSFEGYLIKASPGEALPWHGGLRCSTTRPARSRSTACASTSTARAPAADDGGTRRVCGGRFPSSLLEGSTRAEFADWWPTVCTAFNS
jgi:hypothetical protein